MRCAPPNTPSGQCPTINTGPTLPAAGGCECGMKARSDNSSVAAVSRFGVETPDLPGWSKLQLLNDLKEKTKRFVNPIVYVVSGDLTADFESHDERETPVGPPRRRSATRLLRRINCLRGGHAWQLYRLRGHAWGRSERLDRRRAKSARSRRTDER